MPTSCISTGRRASVYEKVSKMYDSAAAFCRHRAFRHVDCGSELRVSCLLQCFSREFDRELRHNTVVRLIFTGKGQLLARPVWVSREDKSIFSSRICKSSAPPAR
jgi:hypothetical protein